LSSTHRSPSRVTANADCVRWLRPGLPARTSAQLRQLQFACGKPPPAAEPNTLTIMVVEGVTPHLEPVFAHDPLREGAHPR
jgi:hypothetical protein